MGVTAAKKSKPSSVWGVYVWVSSDNLPRRAETLEGARHRLRGCTTRRLRRRCNPSRKPRSCAGTSGTTMTFFSLTRRDSEMGARASRVCERRADARCPMPNPARVILSLAIRRLGALEGRRERGEGRRRTWTDWKYSFTNADAARRSPLADPRLPGA